MLPSKQTIHLARFHAEPLPGNPYHAQQVFGAWIVYYALAPDSEAFAQKIKNFLAQEKWKLIQLGIRNDISRATRIEATGITSTREAGRLRDDPCKSVFI